MNLLRFSMRIHQIYDCKKYWDKESPNTTKRRRNFQKLIAFELVVFVSHLHIYIYIFVMIGCIANDYSAYNCNFDPIITIIIHNRHFHERFIVHVECAREKLALTDRRKDGVFGKKVFRRAA